MKKILLIAVALVAMIGTAAANPESLQLFEDGSTTALVPNPFTIQNDGSDNNLDIILSDYANKTIGLTHTMTINISTTDGSNLAANEIQLKCNEKDGGAPVYTTTSDGSLDYLILQFNWDHDNDGTGGPDALSDTLDLTIISTGPLNRYYEIQFNDEYDTILGGVTVTDTGAWNRFASNVPEFPTIALPVAAILGLAFIFQRRKEEE